MKIDYQITFGKDFFDVIVCLDATLPERNFFEKFSNIPLLAADGAGLRLYEIQIEPDFIIGDMDTLLNSGKINLFPQEKIIKIDEQETNDFEKVLNFAIDKKYKNVLILGFHGGELEHTLNNWSVLLKYSKILNLTIYDNGRYAIPIHNSFKIHLRKNELISLIPQCEAKITTSNLQWNLHNEILKLGVREGARNVAIDENISIELHSGSFLLFINDRLPYAPKWEKIIE